MIVGIQIGNSSGVAVYDKGKILFAASEERYTRIKNDEGFPENALKHAIDCCELSRQNIDQVVIPTKIMAPYQLLCSFAQYSIEDRIKEENEYYKPKLLMGKDVDYLEVFADKALKSKDEDLLNKLKNKSETERAKIFEQWRISKAAKLLNIEPSIISVINHEYSHAAYGLYASDYSSKEDVITIVYDGWGDESNASVYLYENGRMKQIKKYRDFNVGRFYRFATLLLAMKPNEHEYKVMGLAPYASEYTYRKPLEVYRKAYGFKNGEVVIDPELHDNYFYFKDRMEGMRFDGIAAAVQIETEEMNKELVKYWIEKTGKRKLALSGGVSMNIKANMEIGKLDIVDDIFVAGSGDDTSLCIGAIYAYLDQNGLGKEIKGIENLYLGDNPDDYRDMLDCIDNDKYLILENMPIKDIARLLADGKVLGRISGRMEFGARALGNRSVLADPRDYNVVDRINKKIKNRDFWMPFTPSILDEDSDRYLVNPKGFRYPFMSLACDSTELARKDIPAALHPADHTARPQIVTEETNGSYYELIKSFKSLTGVGALLNTSLNIHGYPIVRDYRDGYFVLNNTDLDGLIVGEKTVILRK